VYVNVYLCVCVCVRVCVCVCCGRRGLRGVRYTKDTLASDVGSCERLLCAMHVARSPPSTLMLRLICAIESKGLDEEMSRC
jgi:hypothetical protein